MKRPDHDTIKAMIVATLDRLNQYGQIVEMWQVRSLLEEAKYEKVRGAFRGMFGDMGLEKLCTAEDVLNELNPPLVVTNVDREARTVTLSTKETVSSTLTPPPATLEAQPKPGPKRAKKAKR